MVLRMPMEASVDEGRFQLKKGDEHFYRVLWADDKPFIKVAYYPKGALKRVLATFSRGLLTNVWNGVANENPLPPLRKKPPQ